MTPERIAELKELAEKATDYLASGGFFNPESMEHDKVRDLIIDFRTAVPELVAEVERLTGLLSEAIDEVESWAGYAPEWAKEKWSFNEILNDLRARAALGGQP